ncbi:MAG: TVP38/TMEM64 family protein [Thermoanaerobaculia bacterium]
MRRTLKVVAILAVIGAVIFAIRVLPVAQWLESFQTFVREAGPLGYVLYVIVYVICCVLLIPALALTLGAGAIFGFAAGSAVVIVGATLGATAAFLLGRTVFRKRVEAMVAANPRMAAIDRAIAAEGTKIMLLMRLSGFPPFTWINYALGLTGVRLRPYILTTLFGIIPGTLAFTWAGAAGAAALTGSGNRISLIVTAAGAVLVSVYIARIASRAIRRAGVAR